MSDDCKEFLEFCRTYGDDLTGNMLQRICECHYAREYNSDPDIDFWKIDSAGDMLNYTLYGTIIHGARRWEFEIEDGNNNGTVVRSWERGWKHGGWPAPQQTAWLFATFPAIITRLLVDGLESKLLDEFEILRRASDAV